MSTTYQQDCIICGDEFESKSPAAKYCSEECRKESRRQRRAQKSEPKTCAYRHCDRSLTDLSNPRQKYCPDEDKKCGYREKRYRQLERDDQTNPPYPDPEELFLDLQSGECDFCYRKFTPERGNQKYCTSPLCAEYRQVFHLIEDAPDPVKSFNPYVTCQECGLTFIGTIPGGNGSGKADSHFEKEHGLTYEQYRDEHPDSHWMSELSRKKSGHKQRGQKVSEEGRQRMRESQLERYEENEVWNKGLTKVDHPGIRRTAKILSRKYRGSGNPFYGKSHTEGSLEKIREASRSNWDKESFRKKALEARKNSVKSGKHVSRLHAVFIQAMIDSGLWENYDFDAEVFITLEDGSPSPVDIACKEPKIAIEIDGCVWHKCPDHGNYGQFNEDFQGKIDSNVARDEVKNSTLEDLGFEVFRFWEHDIENDLPSCIQKVGEYLDDDVFCPSFAEVDESEFSPSVKSLLADFQLDEEIQADFDFYRTLGFPYYLYDKDERASDFQRLKNFDTSELLNAGDNITIHPSKRSGEKACKYFMPHLWTSNYKGKDSAKEKWEDDEFLVKLIENRKNNAKAGVTEATLRTGLKLLCSVPKIYPSVITKHILGRFFPDRSGLKVLDPSAGWGSRMVGAKSYNEDVTYVGTDPWEETVTQLNEIKEDLSLEGVRLYQEPFEDLSKPPQAPFDLVTTSPPHYDKEHYCDAPTQSDVRYNSYQEWKEGFFRPLFQRSYDWLKAGGYAAFHLTDGDSYSLINDAENMMPDIGFTLQNDILWSRHHVFSNSQRTEKIVVGRKVHPQ